MISIGQRVRIKNTVDEQGDKNFLGQTGEVIKREFGSGGAPVGESSTDPFYIVRTPIGVDGFWTEELEVLP
jgi:hypothetical protein